MKWLLILILLLSSPIPANLHEDLSYNVQVREERAEEVSRGYNRGKEIIATITFYTCGVESTGKSKSHPDYCRTASGYILKPDDAMQMVAADPKYYKFGQRIYIKGIGYAVVVDTGGDIKGEDRFDVYSGEDVKLALKLGRIKREVIILE